MKRTVRRCLAEVAEMLHGEIDQPFEVGYEIKRLNIDLHIPVCPEDFKTEQGCPSFAEMEPPMPAPKEHWKWLSPIEKAVIKILERHPDQWQSAENIGRDVRQLDQADCQINDRELSTILRHMIGRDILESQAGKGFRLKIPTKSAEN